MSPSSPERRGVAAGALVALLTVVGAAHLWALSVLPSPRLFGDEVLYRRHAIEDARRGKWLPVPGALRSDHRPGLPARFHSLVSTPGGDRGDLHRRVTLVQIGLLLGLLGSTFLQARILGLGGAGAVTAAALLGTFPWLAFHVHSQWPEVLHALLANLFLLALITHLRGRRRRHVVLAGVALAYAMLTKAVLLPFVAIAALFLSVATFRRERCEPVLHGLRRSAVPAALLLITVSLLLAPQVVRNARSGLGPALSANAWWNLELGWTVPVDGDDPDVLDARGRWLPKDRLHDRYRASGTTPFERERSARRRWLRHLSREGVGASLVAQGSKFLDLVIVAPGLLPHRRSTLDQALGHRSRWGSEPPPWLGPLADAGRVSWYVLLGLGCVGGVVVRSRGPAWGLVLVYTGYLLAAAFMVPVKIRFLLPLAPPLALLAAASLEEGLRRLRRGRAG